MGPSFSLSRQSARLSDACEPSGSRPWQHKKLNYAEPQATKIGEHSKWSLMSEALRIMFQLELRVLFVSRTLERFLLLGPVITLHSRHPLLKLHFVRSGNVQNPIASHRCALSHSPRFTLSTYVRM